MTTASMSERPLGLPGRILLGVVLAGGLVLARFDVFTVFFYVSYAVVGGLLVWRRPRNSIGWLLVLLAFGFVGTTTTPDLDAAALVRGDAAWGEFLMVWLAAWSGYASFSGFVALMILFPSGRLPAGRWHRPAIALLATCFGLTALSAIAPFVSFNPTGGVATVAVPNRFALLPDLGIWAALPLDALILPIVGCLAIGVASMLARYRRAVGVERLQLRWLVAATAFMVIAIAAGLASILILGPDIGGLAWVGAIVAYPTVPLAIYVAITRHRLYEIDRIISRTIGWAAVTGVLVAVFAGLVVALQAVLAPVTNENTLAVAASTLVAAAMFQPLRRRVQRAVDRRFDRDRYDGERTAERFAGRLRNVVDLSTVRDALVTTAGDAVRPASAAVWLRPGRGRASG
jgi:hypothetical protein